MKNTLIQRTSFFCLLLSATLYGCGGGDYNPIAYVGNTLVIDGRNYDGPADPRKLVPGEVIVTPKEGMREEVRHLIDGYGLRLTREEESHFLVTVPTGFEQQWADALKKHFAVAAAVPNMLHPTAGE